MDINLDVSEVLRNIKENQFRAWTGPRGAAVRLRAGGCITLKHTPKFTLKRSDPVFTIGSCFARGIENELIDRKLPVLLEGHGTLAERFLDFDEATQRMLGSPRGTANRASLNKYSVQSMLHDVRRVLLEERYPNEGLIELEAQKWFDPHSHGLRLCALETALENRRDIARAISQAHQARVVIMTLGLTETWIDTATGLAMNEHPGAAYLARMSEHWRFVDCGFAKTLADVTETIELLRAQCNPDMKFLVTVSPIPLASTAKRQDVVVASSGSKAVLRAVAEELYRRHDHVDYFPSYEYAMWSERAVSWAEDQIHVQPGLIAHITAAFIASYYPEVAP